MGQAPHYFVFQKASDGLDLGCTEVCQWRFDEKKKQVWRVEEEMRKPGQKCNFLGHLFNQGVRRGVSYTPWKPKSSWKWRSSQIKVGGPIWPKIWTKPMMRMWRRWIITKPLWSGAKFRRQKCQSDPNLRGVNTPPPCNVTKVTFFDKCEEIRGGGWQIKPRPLDYMSWTWTCENPEKVTKNPRDKKPRKWNVSSWWFQTS